MKFLTNTYDPSREDAKRMVSALNYETQEQAWEHHLSYLRGKILGRPEASDKYSVEQLEAMGYVGVYAND